MRAVIGMAIGMLVCAGCAQTAQQQSAQQCFLVESAVCATSNDPMTNRPGFGACLANGATLCGVVPASAPVAVPPTKLSRKLADAAGA